MPSTATPSDALRHERIMVFIDGSNLYHVLGEVCGRHDLNFGKFAEKIAGDRQLVRTYYYNIRQDSERDANVASEQGKFLQTMYDTPYLEVRMGVSKRHGETMVEKGVDVFMATDLVAFAFMDLYDTAIVVSGDGDFFPAIQTAKNQGKHIEVAAFDNNLSGEAANVADAIIKLNKTYFTGLWSDRRRRSAPETVTGTARRGRSVRAVPSRSRTTADPTDGEESSATEGSRRPSRRRSTTTRTTTRRRTPIRRTAARSSEATPMPMAEPAAGSVSDGPQIGSPERSGAASNGAGNGAEGTDEGSESRPPIRRTPARRRVGTRSTTSNGNGDAPSPPVPPALRRRGPADDDDDGPSS